MTAFGNRRRLDALSATIGFGAVTVLALAGPLSAAIPSREDIVFKVFRDGEPLGHHRVAFRREAEDLHVEIDIQLELKLAFLTVFRYRHTNHEVWRDGHLVAIETQTDDDGDRYWLSGRATEAGLEVEGSGGSFVAPGDIMPTSYWNVETVTRNRMLDTQRGRLIDVDIVPAGAEIVLVAGQPVNAQRYTVTGDLELHLWYATDGQWTKTSFEARGVEVVYARAERSAAIPGIEDTARGQ